MTVSVTWHAMDRVMSQNVIFLYRIYSNQHHTHHKHHAYFFQSATKKSLVVMGKNCLIGLFSFCKYYEYSLIFFKGLIVVQRRFPFQESIFALNCEITCTTKSPKRNEGLLVEYSVIRGCLCSGALKDECLGKRLVCYSNGFPCHIIYCL